MSAPHRASEMHYDPEKPGLLELLNGEGELVMRVLAWAGVVVLFPLLIVGTVVCWGAIL